MHLGKKQHYKTKNTTSLKVQWPFTNAISLYGTFIKVTSFSSESPDVFSINHTFKTPEGVSNQLFSGIVTFVMGIVAMIRLTRNMPRKITEAAVYGSPVYYNDMMIKSHHQLPAPAMISHADYMTMMKRMAELEEKVTILSMKPTVMPAEKEGMLNAAISRVSALEQELSSTKKVMTNSDLLTSKRKLESKEKNNAFFVLHG